MAKFVPVDLFDLVIFGGGGDLSLRKLLPALYHRDHDGQLPPSSRIIATGRSEMTREAYLEEVEAALRKHLDDHEFTEAQWETFAERLHYVRSDALDASSWGDLNALLEGFDDRTRVFYLATSPSLFGSIASGLNSNGLISKDVRIVLEKPVGKDHASAREINDQVGEFFPEDVIYRIDHYLGKETVQNLLALRFANSLFEPLWNRGNVDHVQITVAEDLGVGQRIEFYDQVGTLRDMVQNHLMQLLCLVAMEPPANRDHDAVRDEKMKVLRALKPIDAASVRSHSVRGQYQSGAIGGEPVKGYLEELGNDDSTTETFVALKVEIDNWRWSGVPFYLRSGKRLKSKYSEIVVEFQQVPHSIFPESSYHVAPNRLVLRLQPDEGVNLTLMSKEPGPGGFDLRPVSLNLSFEETFGVRYPDAYERLLMEVIRGNPALFMRRDEVEAAWQWIDSIIAGWDVASQPVEEYPGGTWGPTAASLLLDRDGRTWGKLD
ncbi:glucose-6-phosphate dehydrogenase [Marinihelvus fidelis]|uniref:Glucose-6-phosphate 1-dehydrogenase n=1 Tax=Marinihelvus fidelis TaxID=2613842 RepID=A0A5N0T5X4_9GAMM|nr:glucose-6-phosphate dehydrogenase [Marinihelvus fidelis]KAA9130460.1 glucose-6-phosphate dehydrogenase [Marinihelvus fidelis]